MAVPVLYELVRKHELRAVGPRDDEDDGAAESPALANAG
jgi:hypothetical protein